MDFLKTTFDKHTKIWSGAKQQLLYDFDCSIGKIIFTSMKNNPKNIVQISDIDGRSVTSREAITWAIRIAQHFKKMGLRHDDVIGIVAKNTTYLMSVVVGCFMNTTPFHAINPIYDEKTLGTLFELTKPKVIFCDGQEYEKVRLATKSLKPLIYTLIDHIDGVPKVEDLLEPTQTEMFYAPAPLKLGGDQTMAILCSSGTTGMPKAVCISNHRLVLENGVITSEDILYSSSGLDWLSGVFVLILAGVQGATRIITTKPYSPEYFVEIVKKHKVTATMLAPRHAATLISCPTATTENLSTIRTANLGGGGISFASLQRLQDIMKNNFVLFGYASTEVGGISATFGLQNGTSVGKLVPGLRVRIVDDNGKNLGHNERSEIYACNGNNWNGYFGNPIETQRVRDSLGWFHTGDIGYFDDKNFLFIVDRKKEILKYQGMHYWPTEIEDVISELPSVEDVCVVGVYDEKNGDAAGAVVVKTKGSSLSEKAVKDHVAKRLNLFYKQLNAGVIFVDKLPQNDNEKTLKREAKALFATTNVLPYSTTNMMIVLSSASFGYGVLSITLRQFVILDQQLVS